MSTCGYHSPRFSEVTLSLSLSRPVGEGRRGMRLARDVDFRDAPFSNTLQCFFESFRITLGSRNGFSRIGSRRSASTEETAPAFRRRLARCYFFIFFVLRFVGTSLQALVLSYSDF